MGVDGRGTQNNDVDVGIRGRMGHLVYGVEAGLESILKVEGEISTSDPQPYRAEITNKITPEIPKVDDAINEGKRPTRKRERTI